MAVYAYTRVSTSRQADEGESLNVQERTIAGYSLMHGLTIAQTFVEAGVSGSKPICDRPQGKALMAVLRPGDTAITARLDRMFRSALDALDILAKLKAQDISLHVIDLGGDVTGNGISKLVFTILSAVAEAERDRIRERVATVKADQRQRGRYLVGKVPFGFRVGDHGELVADPNQQAATVTAKTMRQAGAKLEAIREALQAQHGLKLSMGGLHGILAG
jgi:putative DNA-invertase from lambdoid prophage Rac